MYRVVVKGREDRMVPRQRIEEDAKSAGSDVRIIYDGDIIRFMSRYEIGKAVLTKTRTRTFLEKDGNVTSITKCIGEDYDAPRSALPCLKGDKPCNPQVMRALVSADISWLTLRHLWAIDLQWAVMNDKPALKLNQNTSRTGRILKRLLPKGTTSKAIEQLALKVNGLNPAVSRITELMDTDVYVGMEAAEQGGELGSCMHGKGYWETMDSYLYEGERYPDFSMPPPSETGVYTVLWRRVSDKKLLNGYQNLRAFIWAVEMEDGERAWYMDRIYPANGELTSEWAKDWADRVGIKHVNANYFSATGGGLYGERADAQPAMKHVLRHEIDISDTLPWLDTFRHPSYDLMSVCSPSHGSADDGIDAHETGGEWEMGRVCTCCDGRVNECDVVVDLEGDAHCEECYSEIYEFCEECGEEMSICNAVVVCGHDYCSTGCAYESNSSCEECGEDIPNENAIITDDCECYCCVECVPETEEEGEE